ncbi:MAG: hypothetical protein M1457_01510 [bacterium]|nr:hypothetical protein [bacterium]
MPVRQFTDDERIVRDLAKRYAAQCAEPGQERRRSDWRRLHDRRSVRPLIYVSCFAWREEMSRECLCGDPMLRNYEDHLQWLLFRSIFNDDSVFHPWLAAHPSYQCNGWGVTIERHRTEDKGGSFKIDYALKDLDDLSKLRVPWHEIDEAATTRRVDYLQDLFGDILPIALDRAPAYRMWSGDISTELGYMRGIENIMLDMMYNPEGLHRLLAFMRDGVLRTHEQAEQAGDWNLCAHQNQAMPYAPELPDPAPNVACRRKDLWAFMAGQEYTAVSPAQHDEFLLQYQIPILRHFGLVAYGCCEDLTNKIDILRRIPNLRRIGVAPSANAARCAEQIGDQYVFSYRPSPADMVSYGFDEARIRRIVKHDLEACRANGCHVDITLKDVHTVQGDPNRIRDWVRLIRKIVDEVYG